MRRTISSAALLLATSVSVSVSAALAQSPTLARASAPGSDRALIENALSAAPPSVAEHAGVVGHDGRVLRAGTNGWVCMPDIPDLANDSPMCLDEQWREVIDAWMHKRAPKLTQVGFGYMLRDDLPVSNTDPFATAPTPTNRWLDNSGPHVMVVLPDAALLESVSDDPTNGGPYVMWRGTPYAHIMVPAPRTK